MHSKTFLRMAITTEKKFKKICKNELVFVNFNYLLVKPIKTKTTLLVSERWRVEGQLIRSRAAHPPLVAKTLQLPEGSGLADLKSISQLHSAIRFLVCYCAVSRIEIDWWNSIVSMTFRNLGMGIFTLFLGNSSEEITTFINRILYARSLTVLVIQSIAYGRLVRFKHCWCIGKYFA